MGEKMSELIKNINKQAKEEIVKIGLPEYNFKRIPFTSPRMNYCTYGGLPVGKLIEFFGEEHGGKTTTALDIVANYQASDDGRDVLYIDAENTLDSEWATKLGVDVDSMITYKPTSQSAEEIFQFILDAVDTAEVGLVVIDSLGVLVSQAELGKSVEDATYAGISSALTKFCKKAEMLCQRHRCTCIGINQIRDDMNAMWAGAVKTPGGRAWKHMCSVRMQFSRGKFIDSSGNELKASAENPDGNYVLMSMPKNKTCPPNRRTGFYTLSYDIGIDYLKDLVEVAIKYGVIDKHGAWFDIMDPDTGEILAGKIQGQANVFAFLENQDNEEVLRFVEDFVDKKIYED